MKNYFTILFLVAICCSTALAIKCFQCQSDKEPKCADAKGLQGEDCPEIPAEAKEKGVKGACMRAVIEESGKKMIFRGCGFQQGQMSHCDRIANQTKDCIACDQDNCNGEEAPLTAGQTTAAPAAAGKTAAQAAAAATTAAPKAKATSAPGAASKAKVAMWTPVVGAIIAIFFMYI